MDDRIKFTRHNNIKVFERKVNLMVSDAILRKIISADPLRPIAAADLCRRRTSADLRQHEGRRGAVVPLQPGLALQGRAGQGFLRLSVPS